MKAHHLLIIITLTLSSCGFQLRGTGGITDVNLGSILLQAPADSTIAAEVRSQLQMAEVELVQTTEQAELILSLDGEHFERTVLSVAPDSGKVEEYLLTLGINLSLTDRASQPLLAGENLTASRDYPFDENAVLGMFSLETRIREDLSRQIAAGIIRRLNAAASK